MKSALSMLVGKLNIYRKFNQGFNCSDWYDVKTVLAVSFYSKAKNIRHLRRLDFYNRKFIAQTEQTFVCWGSI